MIRLFAAIVLACAAGAGLAQYPGSTIKLVVPYPPGGPVDALARAVAPAISEELKQPVVVENRTGANEIIAADYVAKSKPDGHTLLVATDAALTMNPHLYRKLPYDPARDLVPVSHLVTVPMVLLGSKALPADTVGDVVRLAKAKPGSLAYASSGPGGITHVPMAMFERNNAVTLSHVPYKGAGALMPDLLSGNVQLSLLAVSVVEQHVKAGSLKALAVSAPARVAALPQVPTFSESGLKDIGGAFFIGLAAPAGTPPEVRERLASLVRNIVTTPAFRTRYLDPFAYTVVASSPTEFANLLRAQTQLQRERIRISGASLD